ncbi:MAG: BcsR/BcsP family cellulose biosynthesis protein [Polynucleobacter sp.]
MKQMNDVEILYDAINENPETYQEIVQHQEVMKSLERWPLIAVINQITPLEVPVPREAVLISSPAKMIRPAPKVAVSETIFIAEALVEKPSIEIPGKNNEIDDEALSIESVKTSAKVFADETLYTPAIEANEKISKPTFNSRNNNRAASENISSLFERLKRS